MSQWGTVADGDLSYSNVSEADDVGDPSDKGYVNERDCCVNGDKHFLKNRWVRNYWFTQKSTSLDFENATTFGKKRVISGWEK